MFKSSSCNVSSCFGYFSPGQSIFAAMFSHHIPPKKQCFFHEWCFTLKQEIHQHLSIYPIISSIFKCLTKNPKKWPFIPLCFKNPKMAFRKTVVFGTLQGQQSCGGPKFRWVRCAFWAPDDGTELGQSLGGTSPGSSTVERCGVLGNSMGNPGRSTMVILSDGIPSGKHTKSYWKWPFIVSFPIKKWWFSIVMLVYQRV